MATSTTDMADAAAPPSVHRRPAIIPTAANRFFWEGALLGRLMIARCGDCGLFMHPPMPICGRCHSAHVAPEPVSGRGSVYSYTIVRRTFHPGFAADVPYVVAIIELDEQAGLNLLSMLIDCPHDQLKVGLEVAVKFERRDEWMLPVFRPLTTASSGAVS